MAKAEAADAADISDGMSIPDELARREERLRKIAEARVKIEARAKERHAREQAEHEAKLAAREAKTAATGKKPGGKLPQPPTEGPCSAQTDPGTGVRHHQSGARIPSILAPRARQGARRVEPRDHGLEYEEDVRPQPRLTRPCAAWRRESRRLPGGDHNAIWTPPNVRRKLAEAKSSSAFCYKASVRRAASRSQNPRN